MMKTTFISTVFNEEINILSFLESIVNQSILPNELIIVDGGSTDGTLSIIKQFSIEHKIKIIILQKKGNRSVGRNLAIENSRNNIILCSDAGCVLDKNWIKNITRPFIDKHVEVVAGYYRGKASNIFEQCEVPYVLVMPDKIAPANFLPATRSMAFRKKVWEDLGGFDEKLSHNEDYAFSKKLILYKKNITFVKSAIVEWIPPTNIFKFIKMIFRFALGDAEAGIIRVKVILIFLRYLILAILIVYLILYHSLFLFIWIMTCFIIYCIWSIYKNYRYVLGVQALIILPLLQGISDICVIAGTVLGSISLLKKILDKRTLSSII